MKQIVEIRDFNDITIGHLKRVLAVPSAFEVEVDWKNKTIYIFTLHE